VANWEGLALCEDYQKKVLIQKEKCIMDFFKRLSLLRYPNFFKNDAIFLHYEKRKIFKDL